MPGLSRQPHSFCSAGQSCVSDICLRSWGAGSGGTGNSQGLGTPPSIPPGPNPEKGAVSSPPCLVLGEVGLTSELLARSNLGLCLWLRRAARVQAWRSGEAPDLRNSEEGEGRGDGEDQEEEKGKEEEGEKEQGEGEGELTEERSLAVCNHPHPGHSWAACPVKLC